MFAFPLPPPRQPQGGRWNAEVAAPGGFGEINVGNAHSSNLPAGEDAAGGLWNNSMSQHRRCNSAPNIMEGITAGSRGSSNWRNAGLPCLSSVVPAPGLRDHAIPEGRRFEVPTSRKLDGLLMDELLVFHLPAVPRGGLEI